MYLECSFFLHVGIRQSSTWRTLGRIRQSLCHMMTLQGSGVQQQLQGANPLMPYYIAGPMSLRSVRKPDG